MVGRMRIREGYKKSEVGVIPEDWDVENIDSMAIVSTGGKNTQDKISSGKYPFYVRSSKIERIDSYSYDGEAVLTAGDGVGTGRVFHYVNGKFDFHQRVYKISDFKSCLNAYYFYLYFSDNFFKRVMGMTAKSSVDSVRREMITDMLIPIPRINEQILIAKALTDTDKLIHSIENLIDKKEKIKQGTMQELLTGKKRLDGFSEQWGENELDKVGITYGGLSGKSKPDFNDGNKTYITFLNVLNNTIIDVNGLEYVNIGASETQNLVRKGDLFFNTSSETPEEVGMCSTLQMDLEETYLNSFCFGFKIYDKDKFDSLYLAYYFRSDEGRKLFLSLAQGATRYNLSRSLFNKLKLPTPPIKEQKAMAQILSHMDLEIDTLKKKLEKYKQVKQGMMQELLTGRIRLI